MATIIRRRGKKNERVEADIPAGVFIEGKPLEEYLEDVERDKKSKEVEGLRKEFEKKKHKSRGTYANERQQQDTRRVAKRVQWLTDHEIRKEYGIMEKPFESQAENAIWVILQKGPVTVKEIGQNLKWNGKPNTLSAMVATVWSRLGNMHPGAAKIIDREKDPHSPAHRYFKAKGIDISPEAAIEQYKLTGTKQHRMKRAAARGEQHEEPETKPPPTTVRKQLTSKTTTAPSTTLNKVVEEVIQTTLGIKVEVSGKVEIVFKFGG